MKTLPRRNLGIAGLITLAACSTYQVAPEGAVSPNSSVRVQFSAPTSLVFQTEAGDSLHVDDVIELDGRVVTHSGNTIAMVASELRRMQPFGDFESTSSSFASPINIRLALSDDAWMLTRQASEERTFGAVVLSVVGGVRCPYRLGDVLTVPEESVGERPWSHEGR